MQIRDIRLEQFGAWEHVEINRLSSGVNVIFLDDGARAIDFSRFLHGMLVGFRQKRGHTNAGSISFRDHQIGRTTSRRDTVWRLDRHARRDGHQSWQIQRDHQAPIADPTALRTIKASMDDDGIERLFVPTNNDHRSEQSCWQWLASRPDITQQLIGPQTKQVTSAHQQPFLKSAAELSLKPHGRVIMDLAQSRDRLIEQISECRAEIERLQAKWIEARSDANVAEETLDAIRATQNNLAAPQPEAVPSQPKAVPPQPVSSPRPVHRPARRRVNLDQIADLEEELRQVRLQLPLLQRAVELTDRWQECKKLRNADLRNAQAAEPSAELESLRRMLAEYQLLDEEKQDLQKTLVKQTRLEKRAVRPKRKGKRTDEFTVRRLLDQRKWVSKAAATPTSVALDVSNEQHEEIRHAAHLLITARRNHQRAQRKLNEFSKRTQFDWSRLFDEPVLPASTIASDSPIHNEPPEKRLAELKRRRIWIREELRCLMERSEMPLTLTWLGILLTLSICSILGTLLMSSHGGQWFTLTFGLAGIVIAGTLKLSLDYRASRRLSSAQDRLRQIDSEILSLTEQSLDAQKDAQAIRRIASERLHAIQLHQDATEADRRLDGAEASYHELLDALGLPLVLDPEEIDRTLRGRESSRTNLSNDKHRSEHSRLRKWLKRARDTVERLDGIRPGKDPIELLSTLEAVFDDIRNQAHTHDQTHAHNPTAKHDRQRRAAGIAKSEFEQRLRREARDGIKRIERRQNSLLRRAKADDQFALERKIEAAEDDEARKRKLKRLEHELQNGISLYEDPEELTELLDSLDPEAIRLRLADTSRRRNELTKRLQQAEQDAMRSSDVRADEAEPNPVTASQATSATAVAATETASPSPVLPSPELPSPAPSSPESPNTNELHAATAEQLEQANSQHQAALRRVDDILSERAEYQRQLDTLRLQLTVLESKLRKALHWSQQSATVRQIARVLLGRPQSPTNTKNTVPFLGDLTYGKWESLVETPQGLAVEDRQGERQPVRSLKDTAPIWLAIQLALASKQAESGGALPLVLLADDLFNTSDAAHTLNVLHNAAEQGLQILLLSSDPQLANQLAETGTPMVRIGLREAEMHDGFAEDERELAA